MAQIIPQSVCTRFGLQIGAFMVWPVKVLICIFFVIAYPVSLLLEKILGPHSGVVYRRAEVRDLLLLR